MPDLPSGHPIFDGKYKRFGPKKKGWYIFREIELKTGKRVVTGAFGFFQGSNRNTVPVTMDSEALSDDERAEFVANQRAYEAKVAAEKAEAANLARNRATDQLNKAKADPDQHPYVLRKGITAEGIAASENGLLLIPMRQYSLTEVKLVGLQKINKDGEKLYNKGMDKIGAGLLLGSLVDAPVIGIGEGYATCRTVRMIPAAAELPVMVAFDAGSLMQIALNLRRDFPDAHLLFLVDDDFLLEERYAESLLEDFKVSLVPRIDGESHNVVADDGQQVCIQATWRRDVNGVDYIEVDVRAGRRIRSYKFENTGVSKSRAAAKAVGNASLVTPVFASRGRNKLTDFNDLYLAESLEIVGAQIQAALSAAVAPVAAPAGVSDAMPPMPDPVPLPLESPPPPGNDGDAAVLSERGEGGSQGKAKEKPKKVYDADHWDQVKYVLDNFVLIYGEDLVWDVRQRMLMKISSMRTIVQNSDVMKFWGGDARKWVLKKNIVFDPAETPSPAVSGATATVNLFSGWKMKPKAGSSIKIQTLLLHLVDGNEDLFTWICRWLAYPLRHPGAKMETSIVMHGDEGSGKNFFFEKVVKKIYGDYGYVIGNAQLESQFNDWASMKLFMVADEVVTRGELKHMKGKLKYLISGESIIVNPKGLPEHSEANHINFVFLSNELQPLALDKTDRRYLVIWTPPALSKEFYIEVAEEIATGGIEAFYDFLMHEVDMGDFNEHTKPIYTDAKDNLIEKSLSPPERFYRDWSRGFLPLPFFTVGVNQLYDAYRVWCDRSGEPKYISLTVFSPTVERYAGDVIKKKLIKYDLGNVVKQRSVFLIGNQPEGKTLADWAADTTALFEKDLKAYRSRSGSNVEGDP